MAKAVSGIWLIKGAITVLELACHAAMLGGVPGNLLEARTLTELNLTAPRPRYSVLGSERGQLLPPVEKALRQYFVDRQDFEHENRILHFDPDNRVAKSERGTVAAKNM